MSALVFTIDVAHPPRHPNQVEQDMLTAWETVRNSQTFRVLKIIHGKGTPERGSQTRIVVRNWLFRNRNRFRLVIDGEDFNLYNATVGEMLKVIGNLDDPDLAEANSGVTVVWVK